MWRGGVTVCGVVMLRYVAWWCYGVWLGGVTVRGGATVCGVVMLRYVAW